MADEPIEVSLKEAKRAKRAYDAARYAVIRKQRLIQMRAYYAANSEQMRSYAQAKRDADRDGYNAHIREIRAANPEPHRQASKKWASANPEKVKAIGTRWSLANPEKHRAVGRAAVARRRAKKLEIGGTYTAADAVKILAAQKHKCGYCKANLRKTGHHIDHIMPIKRGGSSAPCNLQALCPTCNRRKSAKHPVAFAQELGLLI